MDDRAYPARPILGVGAVIVVDGCVVLIRRRNPPLAGRWALPGGVIETGESVRDAVVREAMEETGLDVTVEDLVEVYEHVDRDEGDRVRHHYVILDYLCRAAGGSLVAGGDAAEVALVDPGAMREYDVTDATARVVRRARRLDALKENPSR